jgi:hypothetical protein
MKYSPKYPIYIISKGRAKSRHTARALEAMNTEYRIAIEPQEYDEYAAVIDPKKILVLPFSNHGKGSGPARNWCWEHSIAEGHKRHWILDDNIADFYRFENGKRYRSRSGAIFRATEDFVDRYENIHLASLQYKMFVVDNQFYYPFILNTRVMSCILIQNDCPHRWRAKYNEDVDLSIRVLKDGNCTIVMQSFLCDKLATQTVKGGNTEELYGGGTFEKSKMLVNLHPDVVRLVHRYGRWHHHVDMSPFKDNKLIPVKGLTIPEGNNEYGMCLVEEYGTENQKRISY